MKRLRSIGMLGLAVLASPLLSGTIDKRDYAVNAPSPALAQGGFARSFSGWPTRTLVIAADYQRGNDVESTIQVLDPRAGYRALDVVSLDHRMRALEELPSGAGAGDFVSFDANNQVIVWAGLPARELRRFTLPQAASQNTVLAELSAIVQADADPALEWVVYSNSSLWMVDLESGDVQQAYLSGVQLLRAIEADTDDMSELLLTFPKDPARVIDLPTLDVIRTVPRELRNAVAVGNLDADRASELIVFNASDSGYARAELFPTWSEQPISHYPANSIYHRMRLWDANGDGRDDWIAHTWGGGLSLFSPTAGIQGMSTNLQCGSAMVIENLDADPAIEAVCGSPWSGESVAAAELGTAAWEWRPAPAPFGFSAPILADLDGDGVEEIATVAPPALSGQPNILRIHEPTSLQVMEESLIDPATAETSHSFSVIAAVETHPGAGREVAVAAPASARILLLKAGTSAPLWRTDLTGSQPGRLLGVDIDNDGRDEILVLGSARREPQWLREGVAHLLAPDGTLLWTRFLGGDATEFGQQLLAVDLHAAAGPEILVVFGGRISALQSSDGQLLWSRQADVSDIDLVAQDNQPLLLAMGASFGALLRFDGSLYQSLPGGALAIVSDAAGDVTDVLARTETAVTRFNAVTGVWLGDAVTVGSYPSHEVIDPIVRSSVMPGRLQAWVPVVYGTVRLEADTFASLFGNGFERAH